MTFRDGAQKAQGMTDVKTRLRPTVAYDADFLAWTRAEAAHLRELRPAGVDWQNLAEEIESLGKSLKQRIESSLAVVIMHLLKLKYQPEAAKPGWRSSVIEHRRRIARIVRDSPSLRRYPGSVLAEEYRGARLMAADETSLPLDLFPETCPFTIAQVLGPDFWPEMSKT